jgi:hypothetical protein
MGSDSFVHQGSKDGKKAESTNLHLVSLFFVFTKSSSNNNINNKRNFSLNGIAMYRHYCLQARQGTVGSSVPSKSSKWNILEYI